MQASGSSAAGTIKSAFAKTMSARPWTDFKVKLDTTDILFSFQANSSAPLGPRGTDAKPKVEPFQRECSQKLD